MSTVFENEANKIMSNAPKPDAEATTIKEKSDDVIPKKRGRPKGSTKKSKKAIKARLEHFESGARAINTVIMSVTCAFTGTAEAWASKEKEEVMDKALARYLEIKDYDMPPELALIAAYTAYFSEVSQKEKVRENVVKVYGGKLGRFFSKFSSLKNKFKLKKKDK